MNYLDSLRIAAGKVRTESPLAAVELSREAEDVRIESESLWSAGLTSFL